MATLTWPRPCRIWCLALSPRTYPTPTPGYLHRDAAGYAGKRRQLMLRRRRSGLIDATSDAACRFCHPDPVNGPSLFRCRSWVFSIGQRGIAELADFMQGKESAEQALADVVRPCGRSKIQADHHRRMPPAGAGCCPQSCALNRRADWRKR